MVPESCKNNYLPSAYGKNQLRISHLIVTQLMDGPSKDDDSHKSYPNIDLQQE